MTINIEAFRLRVLIAILLTLPFGWVEFLPIPYASLTLLLMYLYLLLAVAGLPKSLSRTVLLRFGVPLLLMWLIMLIRTMSDGGITEFGSGSQLRQILFHIVFFIFAARDVARMAERGQPLEPYLIAAMLLMALVYLAGFTETHEVTGRATLVGLNANVVALYALSAILVLLDLLLRGKDSGIRKGQGWPAIVAILALLFILYASGSRGGIIILAIATGVYFVGWERLTRKQASLLLLAAPVCVVVLWYSMTTGTVAERLTALDEDIRLTQLWPISIEIIRANPIFGAGFDVTFETFYSRIGRHITHHNEYLKIATSSGLVGLGLFFVFLYRVLQRAVAYRTSTGSALRLALFFVCALQLLKGGGALHNIFIWIILLMVSAPVAFHVPTRQVNHSTWASVR